MRDVTLDGLWWLPDDPDRRIAGTVALSGEDRPTLQLIGTFIHEKQEPGGAFHVTVPERHRMIHGRCEGKAVTLGATVGRVFAYTTLHAVKGR